MGVDEREALLDRLFAVTALMNEDMDRGMRSLGLTPARAHVLWVVSARGPCTQRALAEELSVSARNVTGLVDALVDTGFVTRESHPSDRRATLVTPTPRGRRTADRMVREHRRFAQLLFGDLSESQLRALGSGLEQVSERLTGALRGRP